MMGSYFTYSTKLLLLVIVMQLFGLQQHLLSHRQIIANPVRCRLQAQRQLQEAAK